MSDRDKDQKNEACSYWRKEEMTDRNDADDCQVDLIKRLAEHVNLTRAPESNTQNMRSSQSHENQDERNTCPHEEFRSRSEDNENSACSCEREDEMTDVSDADDSQADLLKRVPAQVNLASAPESDTQNTRRSRGHENQDERSTCPHEEVRARSGVIKPCRLIFGCLCIILISAGLFLNCNERTGKDAKKTLWSQRTKGHPQAQNRFAACLQKEGRCRLLKSSLCSQGVRKTKSMHSCPRDMHSGFQSDEGYVPPEGRACDMQSCFSDDETRLHTGGCPGEMQPRFQDDEACLPSHEGSLCLVFHEVPTASPILDLPPLEDRPASCPLPVSSSRRDGCPRAKHKTR